MGGRGKFIELSLQFLHCLLQHSLVLALALLEGITPVVVMITHQTVIRSLSLLCQFQPSLAFLQDLLSLEIEMTTNDGLKALRRIADILQHSKFDISITDDIRIGLILLLALKGPLFWLEARLIEVNVLTHNDRLDADQYLEESGHLGVPVLHGRATPSAQQTETDLTTSV